MSPDRKREVKDRVSDRRRDGGLKTIFAVL